MNKYRKKPIEIKAIRWFKNGDHPEDNCQSIPKQGGARWFLSEGKVVRYYRNPDDDENRNCIHCGNIMHCHGWIDTKEGGHIVCPGDWIIKGVKGEFYPIKNDIFLETYEKV